MVKKQDLLIEIGTEELPPKSLKNLAAIFKEQMCLALKDEELGFSDANWYATPRRLSLIINDVDTTQKDKKSQRKGPSLSAAFDKNKKPTQATLGFARSCNVGVEKLEKFENEKGAWLVFNTILKGKKTDKLIPKLVETILERLPIAKRMRWGNHNIEFVRPIKWTLILLGNKPLNCKILGIESGTCSYGHRYHYPDALEIKKPSEYIDTLKNKGYVIVDYDERLSLIKTQISKIAKSNKGNVIIDSELLDEVTSLVEWPVSFLGNFEQEFLKLPKEVLIATMQDNQKYFPVANDKGELMPLFICVSNIESSDLESVKRGNERVIRPRLNDAVFFWEWDLKYGLKNHHKSLSDVVYQKDLGTLHDKSERISETLISIAKKMNIDTGSAKTVAKLCFCDLLTKMVSEFPNLQGTMGYYYAKADGENDDLALALEELYQPRFAGDKLPKTLLGQCLSISEKIDSLIGIFSIGKAPTGDKDPFALRRSAIGLLRIIIECEIDIDLKDLLSTAASNFTNKNQTSNCINDVYTFLMERLRYYYRDEGFGADVFESVLAVNTNKPLDFHHRIVAVAEFKKLDEAKSLAAANKRIINLLKKSEKSTSVKIKDSLLVEKSEIKLASKLVDYKKIITPLIDNRNYKSALTELAGLKKDIDNFFDNVMVMCDEAELKKNRLAILNNLNSLFLQTADISKLQD